MLQPYDPGVRILRMCTQSLRGHQANKRDVFSRDMHTLYYMIFASVTQDERLRTGEAHGGMSRPTFHTRCGVTHPATVAGRFSR